MKKPAHEPTKTRRSTTKKSATRSPTNGAPPQPVEHTRSTAAKGEGFFATVKKLLTPVEDQDAPRATALLEKHHRELEKLFATLDAAKADAKRGLLHAIATRVLAHMVIEEKLFYPRAVGIDRSHVLEGYEEHVVIRFALERALVTAPSDETFTAKVKTLKDFLVDHDDEEEEELFPKVRRAMTLEAQRKLGAEMLSLFDETVALGWKKTLAAEGPQTSTRVRKASARATASAAS